MKIGRKTKVKFGKEEKYIKKEDVYKIFEDWFYEHNLQCYEEYLPKLKEKFK